MTQWGCIDDAWSFISQADTDSQAMPGMFDDRPGMRNATMMTQLQLAAGWHDVIDTVRAEVIRRTCSWRDRNRLSYLSVNVAGARLGGRLEKASNLVKEFRW